MPSPVTAGTLFADFRVESLIGEGAMGRVYLAEDTRRGGSVAIKLLAPELARDERFRQRFLRESRIAASLDHPRIVPTVAYGEVEGVLYLALTHVDGVDLRTLLRREGTLQPARALDLLAQVGEALDAAHAAGLVHRDVKPGNILVASGSEGECAYVCDFGLARHVASVGSLTGDRGFVGTIDYVSPEQIEGGPLDGRADVYSLGCVLYECLAGVRPFERESELAVVFAHLNEQPPCLSRWRSDLPAAFDDYFRIALAKSPEERYGSCAESVEAARAALRGEGVGRPRRRRRRIVTAAALATVVCAAIGSILATRSGPPRTPPAITQTSIDGARLGLMPGYYKRLLGGSRAQVLAQPGFPSLAFQRPQIAVYFPAEGRPAGLITTWNRSYRTAAGIGPCSTIDELKRAYGARVRPTWAGSQKGKVYSYALGNNLLFATQDQRTISSVALYRGDPHDTRGGSPQAWANYVAALETACE
jgi:tRNA A-37 threonylcarbamoyl transferase component Bud32